MTTEQLSWIKKAQREFKEKFSTNLEIDWNTMNGVSNTHRFKITRFLKCSLEEVEAKLLELCVENDTSIERIKSIKKISHRKNWKEYFTLMKFAYFCYENNSDLKPCADLVGKERTMINFYAKRYLEYKEKIQKQS